MVWHAMTRQTLVAAGLVNNTHYKKLSTTVSLWRIWRTSLTRISASGYQAHSPLLAHIYNDATKLKRFVVVTAGLSCFFLETKS